MFVVINIHYLVVVSVVVACWLSLFVVVCFVSVVLAAAMLLLFAVAVAAVAFCSYGSRKKGHMNIKKGFGCFCVVLFVSILHVDVV